MIVNEFTGSQVDTYNLDFQSREVKILFINSIPEFIKLSVVAKLVKSFARRGATLFMIDSPEAERAIKLKYCFFDLMESVF